MPTRRHALCTPVRAATGPKRAQSSRRFATASIARESASRANMCRAPSSTSADCKAFAIHSHLGPFPLRTMHTSADSHLGRCGPRRPRERTHRSQAAAVRHACCCAMRSPPRRSPTLAREPAHVPLPRALQAPAGSLPPSLARSLPLSRPPALPPYINSHVHVNLSLQKAGRTARSPGGSRRGTRCGAPALRPRRRGPRAGRRARRPARRDGPAPCASTGPLQRVRNPKPYNPITLNPSNPNPSHGGLPPRALSSAHYIGATCSASSAARELSTSDVESACAAPRRRRFAGS